MGEYRVPTHGQGMDRQRGAERAKARNADCFGSCGGHGPKQAAFVPGGFSAVGIQSVSWTGTPGWKGMASKEERKR